MRGIFGDLTPEQQRAALAYRGKENHGDEKFRRRSQVATERVQLEYLAKSPRPLWGGHLRRGERITDPDMQRWLDNGWIEAVGADGYCITDKGMQFLQQTSGA